MVNYSNKIYLNRRRGISTIVGGIIFLVLLTAGFSSFFVAMDVQQDTINAQRTISNSIIDKTQEQFSIAVATDDSNGYKLGIQVKNAGPNSVQISNIWIINKSEINYPVKNIPVYYNDAFITSGSNSSILETQHLTMVLGDYDIKVVSTLGTIKKAELNVGGNNYLLAEMFTIPPDVRQGENATIALRVTNVGVTMISGVTPNNLLLDDALPPHAQVSYVGPVVNGPIDLNPSESTIFSWDMTLIPTANIGTKVKFSNFATGTESVTGFGVSSNTAFDKIIIRDPKGGAGDEEILKEELFGRPQIFMIFPNAVGDDVNNRASWGVLVANPTDQPMEVTKVVIMAFSPRTTASDKIFMGDCENKSSPNSPLTIPPTTDRWTCPESNQLVWTDLATPAIVQPRSVHPFLVEIGADNFGSSLPDAGNILIQPIVFTSLGQFGKPGYGSTMHSKNTAMPNVFLSKVDSQTTAANNGNILGNITKITEGTSVAFNATLVDMSEDTWGINAGTKLIINIPRDWIYGGVSSSVGFTITSEVTYPDGSTQIVGTLNTGIDERNEARVIKFYATAPAVASTKMYVMHILADGTATGDSTSGVFTVGPIAETVLQVCPTTGCLP